MAHGGGCHSYGMLKIRSLSTDSKEFANFCVNIQTLGKSFSAPLRI